jgi:LytS/YehU family sensor histidine kinase
MFPALFFLACSTSYTLLRDRLRYERLAKEKETENLKTELAFLRSQVSPHFMFNVLNNMVSLARKKSDLLEPSLIKLSSLLRYMLYETDEEKVLLEREIEYLRSYIDLQKQRFGSKVKVNFSTEDIDSAYLIEPMLLIPFVENAFKHGTGMIQNPEINIVLKAKNNLLQFMVSNPYDSTTIEIKDKTSGIGLTNVKRRLNLLYDGDYSLFISNKNEIFSVSLQINLH